MPKTQAAQCDTWQMPFAAMSSFDETKRPQKLGKILRIGIFAAPVLLLLTLFGWGLSSPAGSSPDDVFHVASMWCAYGERDGICEETAVAEERLVPSAIVDMACYAFSPEIGGSCQNGLTEESGSDLAIVKHGNWNGSTYPPLFYAIFGVFATNNVALSVAIIRLVNAALITIALTATMIILPSKIRPILGISTALTLVPLGLFILPSTNPSSWAIVSAAIVFPTFLALAETKGTRRTAIILLLIFGVIVGAGARADAAIFAAFSASLAWFLSIKKSFSSTIILITIYIVTAFIFFSAGQSDAIGGLRDTHSAPTGSNWNLALQNFVQLPILWLGMFNNLGWLDTAISPLALFGVVFAVIGVLFATLATLDLRKGVALGASLLSISLIPLYMLNASSASVGTQVQPRYILPLLIVLIAVSVTPTQNLVRFSKVQLTTLVLLLAGAQSIALQDQLSRYVSGVGTLGLVKGEWWWGGVSLSPLGLLVITTFTYSLLISISAVILYKYQKNSTVINSLNSNSQGVDNNCLQSKNY